MVQTLYARAKETRKKNAKINDEIAVELVKKLDYDFSKADKDNAMTYGVIARTIVLDRMVEQYLEKHANTVVVNIVDWIPDVIEWKENICVGIMWICRKR